jgi:TRAP-type C4-dicarboxylate transport system permease small subunit
MIEILTRKLTNIVLAIAAFVLAVMMFLTAMDVALRYIFNCPLPGAFEIVEYIMAIFIPFSIAYCAQQREHVSVELIMQHLPKGIQTTAHVVTHIIELLFVVMLSWQGFLYVSDTLQSKLCSAVLLIPAYPFVIPSALGIGIFALLLVRDVFHHQPEDEIK